MSPVPAMKNERSTVPYGTRTLAFEIRRSDRRRTVSIAVDAAHVLVTAPTSTPRDRLDQLVRSKAEWILARQRDRAELDTGPVREFVDGETFRYLGRQYRLRSVRGEGPVRLLGGLLVVPVPTDLGGRGQADHVRVALVAWYRARASAYLAERVTRWARRLRLHPARVIVAEPRKRWGSTSADQTIRLNWRILQAPLALVDYVVVHELVHLANPDHTRAFWARVERALPDFAVRKHEIRRLGPTLVW